VISSLRIRDLIVVEDARLDLAPGLNVLTGSTGSGKSVLLAALSLLAGERAKADWIREGSARALVEATVEIEDRLFGKLDALGIESEDRRISLKREILRDGRGRAFIDGTPVSIKELRRLGEVLFESQDQHDQVRLMDSARQLNLLDDYGNLNHVRSRYQNRYRSHKELLKLRKNEAARLEALRSEEEFLRFQLDEIDTLDPRPGEIENLIGRERRVRNAVKIAGALDKALSILEGGNASLHDRLLELDKSLAKLESLGQELKDFDVESFVLEAEELASDLRERKRDLAQEAESGEALVERLHRLHALERKHGKKLEELFSWAEETRRELGEIRDLEDRLAELESRIGESSEILSRLAFDLSSARRRAAAKLEDAWRQQLSSLGMNRVGLRIELRAIDDPEGWVRWEGGRYRAENMGTDSVRILVKTNPDSIEGTLREIPSGGELSRIALAYRLLPGLRERPPVLLLDEVDSGLGADIAPVLAEQLASISKGRQILLVTHQPLLAAAAGRQFNVDKRVRKGRTRVSVRRLGGEERLEEIIRMLGGRSEDRQVREHAEFLLSGEGKRPCGN